MAGEIVVGYDGSACGKAALKFAADVAAHYAVGLYVAFCVEPPAARAGGAGDQRREIEALATGVLDGAPAVIGDTAVAVQTRIVESRPADGLIELADEIDAPVIVVGTKGHGVFRSAVLGSTPNKLLSWSSRPVLVVPEPS